MKRFGLFTLALCQLILTNVVLAQKIELKYRPAPADNPLKGLVPYEGQGEPFPHSMEFWYFPMNKLMTGENTFDWRAVEEKLDIISKRKCQAIIRVFMEYPGQESAVPEFLVEQGVKLTKYKHDGNQNITPDYNDQRTRKAMKAFIAAYGEKYDGDPRIGFITMGILGHWGEWHTYPRDDLFASKEVQTEVMDAFESAFKKTKILMRYPAGLNTWGKAPNHERPFGYHDDSFAWATLSTGRKEDDWYFMPAMRSAGQQASDKWKTQPIGGEIRPEVWGCVFDKPGCAPKGQEFEKCVSQTHASWLMDSGMFSLAKTKPTPERKQEAIRQVQRMGYELYVKEAEFKREARKMIIALSISNRGVAPFYYDWPVEIVVSEPDGTAILTSLTGWKLTEVLPDEIVSWQAELNLPQADVKDPRVAIRVNNPMPGGKSLLFANETQAANGLLKLE